MNYMEIAEELAVDYLPNEVLRAYYENIGNLDFVENYYLGTYSGNDEYDAVAEYVYHEGLADLSCLSDHLQMYFDWYKYGRDMVFNGDVWVARVDGPDCSTREYAIFLNH